MPVRGSSEWQHAIHMKKVINLDDGGYGSVGASGLHFVLCAWLDCDKDGLENFKVRENTARPGYEPRYVNYVFCSERHKQYWLNDIRPGANGNLPPGYRRSIL